jgi:hypothetical protein
MGYNNDVAVITRPVKPQSAWKAHITTIPSTVYAKTGSPTVELNFANYQCVQFNGIFPSIETG